ncbi:aldehyde dehydrogenase family protein [Nocardia rhamnosiphila]|uniref:Aldehyde dehydrogenase family protein n=1 Tax=Nocardia rhamnosiphila TaxID=426716 RepID=A0ABV2WJP2_9NOCA|nr:aldehyde dehydrogenase family protein [Nocardia rhamnosiphila]
MSDSSTGVVAALVGGDAVTTAGTYTIDNPYTEATLAEIADCGVAEADAAVEAARAAQPAWAAAPLERRRAVLDTAAETLERERDLLVDLAIRDTGAPCAVAADLQVDAAVARLRAWARRDERTLAMAGPPPAAGLTGSVRRIPVGVVACISPYNFPLLAMIGKVAPALFAGNAVVMKPAPQDPLLVHRLALALAGALRAQGAPAGAVNLVTGADARAGAALVDNPDVGAVSFTGSTAVGEQIYRSAAPSTKRLLLELGGKGAMIVRADADLDAVVRSATRTWTVQAGQVCLTTARILVDHRVHDELVALLTNRLTALRYGDPAEPTTDITPLISDRQRRHVAGLVAAARAEGSTVAQAPGAPERGWFHPATLLTECAPQHTAMQEEAFGPLLCVMRTADDEEAVAAANATRFGLSNYVFTRDRPAAERIAGRLRSAQVGINTVARHPDLPFGGLGASGLGRSGGAYALDVYTDCQAVATAEGTVE